MTPSAKWFPRSLQERAPWFTNFNTNIQTVGSSLGLTVPELASIADDAAPRASNITKTPSTPRHAAPFTPVIQQAPCHNKKPNKIAAFPISPDPLEPEPHRQ